MVVPPPPTYRNSVGISALSKLFEFFDFQLKVCLRYGPYNVSSIDLNLKISLAQVQIKITGKFINVNAGTEFDKVNNGNTRAKSDLL